MEIEPTAGGITSRLVMMALDGAMNRHTAIATNIANSSTENYRPMSARFDALVEQVRQAVNSGRPDAQLARDIDSVRRDMRSQPLAENPTEARVALDAEMARLAKNTLHYQALLAAQGKNTSILRMAIKEGRE